MISARFATDDDASAITDIATSVQAIHAMARSDVFRPPSAASLPVADVRALLRTVDHPIWVACDDTHVVGYLVAEVQRRPATSVKHATVRLYIHQMGVRPETRGQGVGTVLIKAVQNHSAALGYDHLVLDVWHFNHDARAFYEAQGFTTTREELWLSLAPSRTDIDSRYSERCN